MSVLKRIYPFNAVQTVNILSEFGPLISMFIINATNGIIAGTWALIIGTGIAMAIMMMVLGRLPIFPMIASGVTIVFGIMTLITGDPMWIQIKVTIFNIMFALFLFGGLFFNKNFFKHIFEGTFHYTKVGWDRFTFSFAWFFVLTAVLNEFVRLYFEKSTMYPQAGSLFHQILGFQMNGVNVWILFKIGFIMPLSGLYAWYLTRIMAKHRISEEEALPAQAPAEKTSTSSPRKDNMQFAAITVTDGTPSGPR